MPCHMRACASRRLALPSPCFCSVRRYTQHSQDIVGTHQGALRTGSDWPASLAQVKGCWTMDGEPCDEKVTSDYSAALQLSL